jgi:hypothetical protein
MNVEWHKMTPEQAKIEADLVSESMKDKFPKIVQHFNEEAVKYQNQQIPKEAFHQELQCMERGVLEVLKMLSLYMDIFDSYQANIGNKEQIQSFITNATTNSVRLLGVINRHFKILETAQ